MSKQIGTIHDFYEWVRGREPTEIYFYYDSCNCANAQYHKERGIPYTIDCADPSPLERAAMQDNTHPDPDHRNRALTMGGLRKEIEEYYLCQSPSL